MPRYTFKEGMCAECGSTYKGFICEEAPQRNTCASCRTDTAVENAQTLYYKEFIPYWDSGLGEYVTSKQRRKDFMAASGLVEMSDVASNDNYLVDDMESVVRQSKRDNKKESKMDNEFLEVYREVEAKSGSTL